MILTEINFSLNYQIRIVIVTCEYIINNEVSIFETESWVLTDYNVCPARYAHAQQRELLEIDSNRFFLNWFKTNKIAGAFPFGLINTRICSNSFANAGTLKIII